MDEKKQKSIFVSTTQDIIEHPYMRSHTGLPLPTNAFFKNSELNTVEHLRLQLRPNDSLYII